MKPISGPFKRPKQRRKASTWRSQTNYLMTSPNLSFFRKLMVLLNLKIRKIRKLSKVNEPDFVIFSQAHWESKLENPKNQDTDMRRIPFFPKNHLSRFSGYIEVFWRNFFRKQGDLDFQKRRFDRETRKNENFKKSRFKRLFRISIWPKRARFGPAFTLG